MESTSTKMFYMKINEFIQKEVDNNRLKLLMNYTVPITDIALEKIEVQESPDDYDRFFQYELKYYFVLYDEEHKPFYSSGLVAFFIDELAKHESSRKITTIIMLEEPENNDEIIASFLDEVGFNEFIIDNRIDCQAINQFIRLKTNPS